MTEENQAIDLTDEELFTQALLEAQQEGQASLERFYEIVIKNELTKAALIPAPHQKLLFSFIEAHSWCVVRIPVSTSKTFSMGACALWYLGNESSERWAIVSGAQSQSKKVLKMISDYITDPDLASDLSLVFPQLMKSPNQNDVWTQDKITVKRPPGIRDPSVIAIGLEGKIVGSRLSGLVADDLLDHQNTRTPEARENTLSNFFGSIIPRMDPMGSRAVVTNTPWHRKDLTFSLEEIYGWATITMDIYGFIRISNADTAWMMEALDKYIRPSTTRTGGAYDWYRLRAFDPDPNEETVLWEERFSAERINEIRYGKDGNGAMPPHEFARAYLCQPLSDDANRCQRDWIEKCKLRGRGLEILGKYEGNLRVATGIDLGIGKGSTHDRTVFFSILEHEDGSKQLIDIQSGRFSGPRIIDILIEKAELFGSMIMVEGNAAQRFIEEFARDKKVNLRVQSMTTTKINKFHMDFGVESVFTEIQNGVWIIPCEDRTGKVTKDIQHWIDDCLYYQPPPAHTGDYLMASWLAKEALRSRQTVNCEPYVGPTRQLINQGGF